MDATTTTIVPGRLVMPLQSWPTAGLHGRSHPSWKNNAEAQAALGPTLANWLYSGKLEYVAPGQRAHIIIEPVGAVPKSSHPFHRLITNAHLGNHIYAAWGSAYHSIDDAAMSLDDSNPSTSSSAWISRMPTIRPPSPAERKAS